MAPLDEKDIISVCHFSYYLGGDCIYPVRPSTLTKEETFLLMNRLYISLTVTTLTVSTFHYNCKWGRSSADRQVALVTSVCY